MVKTDFCLMTCMLWKCTYYVVKKNIGAIRIASLMKQFPVQMFAAITKHVCVNAAIGIFYKLICVND